MLSTNQLFVANEGDGTVKIFDGNFPRTLTISVTTPGANT